MKKFLAATALLTVTSTAAFASDYPVEIVKDGVVYNCAADVTMVDGQATRNCITAGGSNTSGGGLFALAGLGGIGASLGLIAAIVTVATVAATDDDEPTTGTN